MLTGEVIRFNFDISFLLVLAAVLLLKNDMRRLCFLGRALYGFLKVIFNGFLKKRTGPYDVLEKRA